MAARYLKAEIDDSAIKAELIFQKRTNGSSGRMKISEDQSLYKDKNSNKSDEIDSGFTRLRFYRFGS